MLVRICYILNKDYSLVLKNIEVDVDNNDFITLEIIFEIIDNDLDDGNSGIQIPTKQKHLFKVEYNKIHNEKSDKIIIKTNVQDLTLNKQNFLNQVFYYFIKFLIEKKDEKNYQEYFQYLFDNYNDLLKKYIEELCSDNDDSINSFAMDLLSKFDHNLKETINQVFEDYNEENNTNTNRNRNNNNRP